jgi:superoxide dismutase, Fe-Mn family
MFSSMTWQMPLHTFFVFLTVTRFAFAESSQFTMSDNITDVHTLPDLPYPYNASSLSRLNIGTWPLFKLTLPQALEPAISERIMVLHHTKHHRAYVDNLNAAHARLHSSAEPIGEAEIEALTETINFNFGGHINHGLFWLNLAPYDSPNTKTSEAPSLMAAIDAKWGSFIKFQEFYTTKLLGIKGSGWGWLCATSGGPNSSPELDIITTKDQNIVPLPAIAIIGIDMWEHAYYLDVCSSCKFRLPCF